MQTVGRVKPPILAHEQRMLTFELKSCRMSLNCFVAAVYVGALKVTWAFVADQIGSSAKFQT